MSSDKTEKSTPMHPDTQKRYFAFAIILAILAVVFLAGIYIGQTNDPAYLAEQVGDTFIGEDPPAADAGSLNQDGVFEIPADALVISTGHSSPDYLIDEYPRNIYVEDQKQLITDLRITRTAVTGTVIDIETGKTAKSMTAFQVVFMDSKKSDGTTVGSTMIISQKLPFKGERKAETLRADEIRFLFQ